MISKKNITYGRDKVGVDYRTFPQSLIYISRLISLGVCSRVPLNVDDLVFY